jgi:3-oxoacyl-(acyl-carrier-protein) synthase
MKTLISEIVVTGYSAISAAGIGIAPILDLMRSGSDALTGIPPDVLDRDDYRWGKVHGFTASDFMSPLKARKMDRCGQFAVAVAGLALKDAGLNVKELAPERVGIVLGSGFCGISNAAEFMTGYFTGGVEGLVPMIFPNTVPNAPASYASIEHGFKGPNVTVVQRFCSAETAFMMACRFIEEGRADVMLTGGADELIPLIIQGINALGQMTRTSVPFGEGCGMIVLESAAHAARRGAEVKARIEAITTIGMLAPGHEGEGLTLLTDGAESSSLVLLSGTAADMPELQKRISACTSIDTGHVIGRSLAMGGTAMAVLLASLQPGQSGLHLAASPQGPYYAIRCQGGRSV